MVHGVGVHCVGAVQVVVVTEWMTHSLNRDICFRMKHSFLVTIKVARLRLKLLNIQFTTLIIF